MLIEARTDEFKGFPQVPATNGSGGIHIGPDALYFDFGTSASKHVIDTWELLRNLLVLYADQQKQYPTFSISRPPHNDGEHLCFLRKPDDRLLMVNRLLFVRTLLVMVFRRPCDERSNGNG